MTSLVLSYSTYHTGYDTFDYVAKFIDPGFRGRRTFRCHFFVTFLILAAKKVTEVTAGLLLRVSMFENFPISVEPMNKILSDLTDILQNIQTDLIPGQYQEVVKAKNL